MTAPKTKHTPGPWRDCEPSSNFEHGKKVIKSDRPDSDGSALAYVLRGKNHSVQLANARLIAAAPDLLEKGQALLDFLAQYPHQFPTDISGVESDFRIAVRKAGGEG